MQWPYSCKSDCHQQRALLQQTAATFEDAQGLSIINNSWVFFFFFPLSVSFLAPRTMAMIFQKSLVILSCAQVLQTS